VRRGAGGAGSRKLVDGSCRLRFDGARVDTACSDPDTRRQWVRPLRGGCGSAAVMGAATGVTNGEFIRFRYCSVAMMGRLTKAAGMGRHGRRRQRQLGEMPGKREKQQKAGGQTLHAFGAEPPIGSKHRTRRRAGASTSLRAPCKFCVISFQRKILNSHFSQKSEKKSEKWGSCQLASYLPTISPCKPEIALSTSFFSFSGTLNLLSVAIRSFTDAFQSSSVMPRPVWAVFMSCPV
jgi:hypothetical protein